MELSNVKLNGVRNMWQNSYFQVVLESSESYVMATES